MALDREFSGKKPGVRKIIVCADDFGMNEGIDGGIVELASRGQLSAISCLALGPSVRNNANALLAVPTMDIGLHVNFSEDLGDNQPTLPLASLIIGCYLGRVSLPWIDATLERQFDAFEECFGRIPDYVDGHQHVHQLPMIRQRLLKLIARRYPGKRLWIRSTMAPTLFRRRFPYRRKAKIIEFLGARRLRSLVERLGLSMNRHLLGVYDFAASMNNYHDLLLQWMTLMQQGDLLMCHPANAACAGDALGEQRVREYRVFTETGIASRLSDLGLVVARLVDIVEEIEVQVT